MIINKLYVKNFGKFNNKEIELKEGINVVFGLNEAGKSTVHKFIEGMFFGFFKPYLKTKKYSDEHSKYIPWKNSTQYEGVLVCQVGDRSYRIERNFLKGKDDVKIFDNISGEDLTKYVSYNQITKLPEPAQALFGFNKSTFTNTISISQLKSKTETELAIEIKNCLTNMSSTRDEEISIENIIRQLDYKRDQIGTQRRSQSILGKTIIKIQALEEELLNARNIKEKIDSKKTKLQTLKNHENNLDKTVNEQEKIMNSMYQKELILKYEKAKMLSKDLDRVEKQIKPLKIYESIDEEKIQNIFNSESQLKVLNDQKSIIDKEKEDLLSKFNIIKNKLNNSRLKGMKIEELEELNLARDFESYRELYNNKVRLEKSISSIDISSNKDHHIEKFLIDCEIFDNIQKEREKWLDKQQQSKLDDLNEQKNKIRRRQWQCNVIGLVLMVVGIIGWIVLSGIIKYLCIMAGVISFVCFWYRGSMQKDKYSELLDDISLFKVEQDDIKRKITSEQKVILAKYRMKSVQELKNKKETLLRNQAKYDTSTEFYEEKKNELKILNRKLIKIDTRIVKVLKIFGYSVKTINEALVEKINNDIKEYRVLLQKENYLKINLEQLEKKLEQIETKINEQKNIHNSYMEILKSNKNTNINEVRKNKQILSKLTYEEEKIKGLLNQLLNDSTLEQIKRKINMRIEEVSNVEVGNRDLESKKLKEFQEDLHRIRKEIGILETEISEISMRTRSVGEIQSEIKDQLKLKEDLDLKQKVIDLAKETILTISKDIHRDFAPKLNDEVNKIIKDITNNKYQKVKVSEEMRLTVKDSKNNKFIPIEDLSLGTMDQMYFALRLGIMKFIKQQEDYPIILDDAFIQYDDERTKNVINWLAKEGKRQIIIFTCHRREKRILDSEGIEHNFIEVSS